MTQEMPSKAPNHAQERETREIDAKVRADKLTRLAAHLLRQRSLGLPTIITDEALQLMHDSAQALLEVA